MASDVKALERIEAHGIAVDGRAIEAEFDRIWRTTEDGAEDAPGVRVRTLNLVAVGAAAEDAARFEQVMQKLPERHPCRGIFALTAAPYERMAASISAHCWRTAASQRRVCSEEIVLTSAPSQEREVASAVLGLLVPELPVAVWMMGEPGGERDLAGRVLDAGDSAILDSARARDTLDAYRSIVTLEEDHEVRLLDLAWARLASWRALIAQMFDGDAGARELAQITQIAVRGGSGAASSEAMLTAGWLASRLEFALADASVRDGSVEASFYDASRGVRVTVSPGGTALDQVSIRTTDAQFSIELRAGGGHLDVREAWDSGATHRVVEQAHEDEGELLAASLDGMGDGEPYREALAVAASLLDG